MKRSSAMRRANNTVGKEVAKEVDRRMNYSARISTRSVKQLGYISPQAHMSKTLQLAAMQCARHGHIKGKFLSGDTPPRFLCQRCMKVLEPDDKVA